jgi:hypothetical protein
LGALSKKAAKSVGTKVKDEALKRAEELKKEAVNKAQKMAKDALKHPRFVPVAPYVQSRPPPRTPETFSKANWDAVLSGRDPDAVTPRPLPRKPETSSKAKWDAVLSGQDPDAGTPRALTSDPDAVAGNIRNYGDPNAFEEAVLNKRRELFADPDRRGNSECAFQICRRAFVGFCEKFGHVLVTSPASTPGSSFGHKALQLTLFEPGAHTGADFGAIAARFYDLKKHTSLPRMAHNHDGLDGEARRLRLWLHGWSREDAYKELTELQVIARNPAMFWTQNWERFLTLNVQFIVMSMLLDLFEQMIQEFHMRPLSWNEPPAENTNFTNAIAEYETAMKGSFGLSSQKRTTAIVKGVLGFTTALLFGWLGADRNWRARATYTGLGAAAITSVPPYMQANGKVQIDNHAIDQTKGASERAPGFAVIFDDLAAYAAVRAEWGEKHLLGNLKFMTGGEKPRKPSLRASHAVMLGTTAFIAALGATV